MAYNKLIVVELQNYSLYLLFADEVVKIEMICRIQALVICYNIILNINYKPKVPLWRLIALAMHPQLSFYIHESRYSHYNLLVFSHID